MGYVDRSSPPPTSPSRSRNKDAPGRGHDYEAKLGTTVTPSSACGPVRPQGPHQAGCMAIAEKALKDLDVIVVGDVMSGAGVLPRGTWTQRGRRPKADEVYKQILAMALPLPHPTGWDRLGQHAGPHGGRDRADARRVHRLSASAASGCSCSTTGHAGLPLAARGRPMEGITCSSTRT